MNKRNAPAPVYLELDAAKFLALDTLVATRILECVKTIHEARRYVVTDPDARAVSEKTRAELMGLQEVQADLTKLREQFKGVSI